MIIREAKKTMEDYTIIVDMAENHPCPEYDCSFEEWKEAFKNIVQNHKLRAWIAFEGDNPIGYIIGMDDSPIEKQIFVYDLFVKKDFRGKGIPEIFIKYIIEWAKQTNALRCKWCSRYTSEKWLKVINGIIGKDTKIKEQKTFTWEVS